MASQDVHQSHIIRVNAVDYPWEEVDVVHAPGHVTRYLMWNGEDGKLTGEIKDITPRGITFRTMTDQDIVDLGMLAIRTKWGLKPKPSSSTDENRDTDHS